MSIKVGDLVMVTKPAPCCGSVHGIGSVFTVTAVQHFENKWCMACGAAGSGTGVEGHDLFPILKASRLIKIDPPSLPESLEREKELSV